MISIKGINKYTDFEKAVLKRFLYNMIEDTITSDMRYVCTIYFEKRYACKDCTYKHLCKDINDLLKSGILDESKVK